MRGLQQEELTPREFAIQAHDKEMYELQMQHEQRLATINLEAAKLEAKWSSWLRIPQTIIKLPVYILLAIGFIINSFRREAKIDPNMWELFKK